MKYRIVKSKDGFKIIRNPDGENKSLGTEKTLEKAQAKLRKIVTSKG